MDKLAFYGKGGIGKSTVSTNVSAVLARGGRRVLHVGCDPKHDSTLPFLEAAPAVTVLDTLFRVPAGALTREHLVMQGRLGIDCIESGGPEPGVGCGGRGVSRMFELLDELRVLDGERYDVAVFDVLGDVVCGGFAAPLRLGPDAQVYLVVSGEMLTLYAANNIAHGLVNVSRRGGGRLAGVIANLRGSPWERPLIESFAETLGTRVVGWIPMDRHVALADMARVTVVERSPEAPAALALRELAETILTRSQQELILPRPFSDEELETLCRHHLSECEV